MNITLLGNGFDLYYILPTKYVNFLNTVHYLSSNNLHDLKTLGDVFGNETLQEADPWIAKSYQAYKEIYDNVSFSFDDADKLIALSDNMWFRYLWSSLNKDIGWIDFETEIAFVIKCFQERFLLTASYRNYDKTPLSAEAEYIIKKFNFFLGDKSHQQFYADHGLQDTKPEYCSEYPVGSGNLILDKKKIVDVLSNNLTNLAAGLKTYLNCFVDRILPELISKKKISEFNAIRYSDYVVTFNYSNTFEQFKLSDQIFHIHGTLGGNIVLGINPDSNDTVENVDTTFIAFKKYYQRTMFESDRAYIKWISDNKNSKEYTHLIVVGHSLDISDKDIIAELFDLANEIVILYHDENAKSNYIANLVKVFGSNGFSSLKYEKKLSFISLYSDHTSLVETRKQTRSSEQYKVSWVY